MTARRKAVPKRLEKSLYQEVESRCPLCGEDNVTALQIHHIKPYAETLRHDPNEMIVICASCHARADAGEIPRSQLYSAKSAHKTLKFPCPQPAVSQNVCGNGNIVAVGDVSIKISGGRSRRDAVPRVAGTVCDDPRKVGYLLYLVDRYNQFRAWHCNKQGEPMRWGFIYTAYKRHMKYAIKTTPITAFENGAAYLKKRILDTMLGRNLTAKGQRVYSSFDDFDDHGDLSTPVV